MLGCRTLQQSRRRRHLSGSTSWPWRGSDALKLLETCVCFAGSVSTCQIGVRITLATLAVLLLPKSLNAHHTMTKEDYDERGPSHIHKKC